MSDKRYADIADAYAQALASGRCESVAYAGGGSAEAYAIPSSSTNAVDGQSVPVRHFGVILEMVGWRDLAERLTAAGTVFLIDPQVRFEGQTGEQATMFFLDPSGNALEFKAFKDDALVFAI